MYLHYNLVMILIPEVDLASLVTDSFQHFSVSYFRNFSILCGLIILNLKYGHIFICDISSAGLHDRLIVFAKQSIGASFRLK